MEQTLDVAAQENNIDAFYGLLGQAPYILDHIDAIPFVQTHLHTAASAGLTHLASEVLRLKPSLGKKLNLDGLSALDLALRGGHTQTVRGLIKHDPQLIRVKGKRGITPLHYVAEAEDRADLLAEFLYRCPKSIEDLTIAGESAVHIAVNNSNLRGFKVLLGWMEETGNKHILEWEDENGNTPFVRHNPPATYKLLNRNAARLIIKQRTFRRAINCCNMAGLTALDIALGHPNAEENGSTAKALCAAGAKRSSSHSKTINLADYCALIPARSWLGYFSAPNSRLVKVPNPRNPSINSMSSETRSALLVVAVLIATATYQAILNPPGGLVSGSTDISTNSTSNSTHAGCSGWCWPIYGFMLGVVPLVPSLDFVDGEGAKVVELSLFFVSAACIATSICVTLELRSRLSATSIALIALPVFQDADVVPLCRVERTELGVRLLLLRLKRCYVTAAWLKAVSAAEILHTSLSIGLGVHIKLWEGNLLMARGKTNDSGVSSAIAKWEYEIECYYVQLLQEHKEVGNLSKNNINACVFEDVRID
nr:ankyrin repeat-containing protein BDA1-like [Coffea arabica]